VTLYTIWEDKKEAFWKEGKRDGYFLLKNSFFDDILFLYGV